MAHKEAELNEQQLEAVKHKDGPMMVLAGPGSGKTMVITYRIKYLITKYKIPARNILVITFTKAAAEEMKERFFKLMDSTDINLNGISFGTFHSIFFRIIRSVKHYTMNNILKEDKKYKILQAIIKKYNIDYEDEQEFIKQFQTEMSVMKNELIALKYYQPMVCSLEDFNKIVTSYENFKITNNMIDFDDMLTECYQILRDNKDVLRYWQSKYPYILVDEFQDINRVQYEITKMLASKYQNLFIVGDDDQSIYRFRGARPEFLLNFPEDYPDAKSVILNINYRSNKNIVKSSCNIIKNNVVRYNKNIIAFNGSGPLPKIVVYDDANEESINIAKSLMEFNKNGISYNDMAVIFRTNLQARALVDVFFDMHLPFILRDQAPSVYEHWVVKDIIAYLKLALDKNDNQSLIRIINKPKRYISKWMIDSCYSEKKSLINNLYLSPDLKSWQVRRIEELDFQIKQILKKKPYDAIKFIRKNIGYDDYIKEYGDFKKISTKGLFEILNEVQESTVNFDTIDMWLNHVNDIILKIKTNDNRSTSNKDKITLSTMHGSKGLEFKIVWIAGAVEGIIPHEKSTKPEAVEEERRLFYVGVTRAKEYLYISTLKKKYEEEVAASRFLDEMYENITKSDFADDMIIFHKEYGKGKILKHKDKVFSIKFDKYILPKKLDIDFCLKNKLLSVIK